MIPLRDENPTRRPAIVTIFLILVCCAVYFVVQRGASSTLAADPQSQSAADVKFTLDHAAIPAEVIHDRPLTREEVAAEYGPDAPLVLCDAAPEAVVTRDACDTHKNVYLAILVSMFLHGSLLHLGGNMLFLWVFGNNIEDARGRLRYLLFYLAAGLVAMAAHVAVDPGSTVPVIGASGAIAGVMGAYLVLYPRAPIQTLLILIIPFFRRIQARWLLLFWFVEQLFLQQTGVAWAAHVGGFLFGALAAVVWRASGTPERSTVPAH